jgi:hypothetical protein
VHSFSRLLSDEILRNANAESKFRQVCAKKGIPMLGCTIKIKPMGLNLIDEGLSQAVGQSIAFSLE